MKILIIMAMLVTVNVNVVNAESHKTSVKIVEEILKDRKITFLEEIKLKKATETNVERRARQIYMANKVIITDADRALSFIRQECTQRIEVLTQKLISFIDEQKTRGIKLLEKRDKEDIHVDYIGEFYKYYGLENSLVVQHLVSVCRKAISLAEIRTAKRPEEFKRMIRNIKVLI